MPPFYTPGDGKFVRQGTSLLYIAGEKTKASAPWGHKIIGLRPVIFYAYFIFVTSIFHSGVQSSESRRQPEPKLPAFGGLTLTDWRAEGTLKQAKEEPAEEPEAEKEEEPEAEADEGKYGKRERPEGRPEWNGEDECPEGMLDRNGWHEQP